LRLIGNVLRCHRVERNVRGPIVAVVTVHAILIEESPLLRGTVERRGPSPGVHGTAEGCDSQDPCEYNVASRHIELRRADTDCPTKEVAWWMMSPAFHTW
jgi:hypothetical protein